MRPWSRRGPLVVLLAGLLRELKWHKPTLVKTSNPLKDVRCLGPGAMIGQRLTTMDAMRRWSPSVSEWPIANPVPEVAIHATLILPSPLLSRMPEQLTHRYAYKTPVAEANGGVDCFQNCECTALTLAAPKSSNTPQRHDRSHGRSLILRGRDFFLSPSQFAGRFYGACSNN